MPQRRFLQVNKPLKCYLLSTACIKLIAYVVLLQLFSIVINPQQSAAVDILRKLGVAVLGAFVLGLDGHTPEVFAQTVEWAKKHVDLAVFTLATPTPSTDFFARLEREGRIIAIDPAAKLRYDWRQFDFAHVVIEPKHFSAYELQHGLGMAYRQFYSPSSIAKRLAKWVSNPFAFFGTLVANKEFWQLRDSGWG
jgi:hypothetical protein